jgi:hypothetical protein
MGINPDKCYVMESTSALRGAIMSIEWFAEVGKTPPYDPQINRAKDFNEGVQHWNNPNFTEARSIAWEAFRGEIFKDERLKKEWVNEFKTINQLVHDSVNGSHKAKSFIACMNISVDDFCRDLPFVGAAGELLIKQKFPNYIFFTSQLNYYLSGHWVCGWNGGLIGNHLEYPRPDFVVF